MSTIIRTVKINLDATYAQDTDIGLYTSGGVSELRYTESPLAGVSTAYKEGLIIDIGAITHRADFRDGGAQVQVSDVEIILGNVVNNEQFNYYLKSKNINLIGLVVEVEEYVGTESDSDATEVVNTFTGSVQSISWNELEFKMAAKSSMADRRNDYLCKKSGDIVIPATFGESIPSRGIYFKAVRTLTVNNILELQDMGQGAAYPPTMKLFPIYSPTTIGATPTLTYQVQLGNTATANATFFEDKYILIKEGRGGSGVYRRIHNCEFLAPTGPNAILQFEIYDYLEEDMIGNATGDHTTGGVRDQTSIQFVDIQREYEIDSAHCNGFYNSDGIKINNAAELYAFNEDGVYRIPGYGYDVNQDNTDNNSLTIDPKLFEGSPDNLLSFLILPVTSILPASTNLSEFGKASNWFKLANGHYYVGQSGDTRTLYDSSIVGDVDDITDKDVSTYQEYYSFFTWAAPESRSWLNIAFLKLPQVPTGYNFTSAYLLCFVDKKSIYAINQDDPIGSYNPYLHPWYLHVVKRGYIDRVNNRFDSGKSQAIYGNYDDSEGSFDNIPDFYPVENRDINCIKFYSNTEKNGSNQIINIGNYKTIDLAVSSIEDYEAIEEVMLGFERHLQYNVGNHYVKERTRIHEVCVALKSTASIKTEVYV